LGKQRKKQPTWLLHMLIPVKKKTNKNRRRDDLSLWPRNKRRTGRKIPTNVGRDERSGGIAERQTGTTFKDQNGEKEEKKKIETSGGRYMITKPSNVIPPKTPRSEMIQAEKSVSSRKKKRAGRERISANSPFEPRERTTMR